ncbi:MAG TPA: FGGY family carbohydrate kinase [Puia sp.]|jgi:sugar (pentulose or hexulose) kinase|nr:FGGY family carbohydrate kinase [Puia sp.]
MQNVIAIFDVGKTNKKLFLFDEQYRIVWERSEVCPQTTDEDGDACEDVVLLTDWVKRSLAEVAALPGLQIKAVNFSAYGASLVHIGFDGTPAAPLYNYLKPYPEDLKKSFYDTYGGEVTFSMLTASPVLGSLNSGMQLYRIKKQRPDLFDSIKVSLHLPQYLSWLVTGMACSDITSIGCHTNLWNFAQQHYHEWVYREGVIDKLAPIMPSTGVLSLAGVGLHDSSAALIPYLQTFREPFVLISTGTWCITLNPFNDSPLTVAELQKDCLCYMSYQGRPVKASRLFAGYEHEQRVKELAARFHKDPAYAETVRYDADCVDAIRRGRRDDDNFEQAYHLLMTDIMTQQVQSTQLVLHDTGVRRIFVDGGFGRNQVYMHMLADAFPDTEVFAASIPQATAMGAALAIHEHWNSHFPPADIIELKYYR